MEGKGDLWHQLAHILDARDPDDPPRPYAPILIEAVDQLEEFFSDFAERWRRGADKEICELQNYWGLKVSDLRVALKKAPCWCPSWAERKYEGKPMCERCVALGLKDEL
jgi:hypothetical protein